MSSPKTASFTPYLSIVAASRNDDHGGDPLRRTQLFVECFARQCEALQLPAEIIIVDWNPVACRPGLAGVLQLPPESSYCQGRVITVPAALHQRLKYGDKMQFFQMIAKNVGIRRARGEFVLATNIDIIFSSELMAFIARRALDPAKMYRVDRYDIKAGIPAGLDLEQTLAYAWANPIRSNRRFGPPALVQHIYGPHQSVRRVTPDADVVDSFAGFELQVDGDTRQLHLDRSVVREHIHTNACGDFTLLSRAAWEDLTGYPEFDAFSFNIDSVGTYAAHYGGYHEVTLLPPCVCFHIEHSLGSGWTPEGEQKLFQRLDQAGILNPEWPVLGQLVDRMIGASERVRFNDDDWGLQNFALPEEPLLTGRFHESPVHPWAPADWPTGRISALRGAFDLDRLTLWHLRRQAPAPENAPCAYGPSHLVQLFVPDYRNIHSEERAVSLDCQLDGRETQFILIEDYQAGTTLRFDPTFRPGIIEIAELSCLDPASGRVLWSIHACNRAQLGLWGNVTLLSAPGGPHGTLRLLITGNDPQLWLPPLPAQGKDVVLAFKIAHHTYSRFEPRRHQG